MFPIPQADGELNLYHATTPFQSTPRIFYVNGVRTTPDTHARTAMCVSYITERLVHGVYNQTDGVGFPECLGDFAQCLSDWQYGFASKVGEIAAGAFDRVSDTLQSLTRKALRLPPPSPEEASRIGETLRRKVSSDRIVAGLDLLFERDNRATLALFRALRARLDEQQIIVAHSQGNLVTASACWALVTAFGEKALDKVVVYSLASPAPAWPLGLRDGRRYVYGHKDDLVTFADPHNLIPFGPFQRTAGDWDKAGSKFGVGLEGHDVGMNMFVRQFATNIRWRLGINPRKVPLDPSAEAEARRILEAPALK